MIKRADGYDYQRVVLPSALFSALTSYTFMMNIDTRLKQGVFLLGDLSLSRVYLKDNQDFPWLVLVPLVENVSEIYELTPKQQANLMEDVTQASQLIKEFFVVDKINVASLGNIVSQLHVHVVGRRSDDPLWPHSIWQANLQPNPYNNPEKWINCFKQSGAFHSS